MSRYKIILGIDPGNTTGIAFWYPETKKLVPVQFKSHIEAILSLYNQLKDLDKLTIRFRIEDARKQRKRPDLNQYARAQGVGSVKARSKDWEDFCLLMGYDYELCVPKNTVYKDSPEKFKMLTGIDTKKTHSHLRDAAVLVFGT